MEATSSTHKTKSYAAALSTSYDTSAQAAETKLMVLRSALEHRRHKVISPYKSDAWRQLFMQSGLIAQYPNIPNCLKLGFDASIPPIRFTYSLPNKSTPLHFNTLCR